MYYLGLKKPKKRLNINCSGGQCSINGRGGQWGLMVSRTVKATLIVVAPPPPPLPLHPTFLNDGHSHLDPITYISQVSSQIKCTNIYMLIPPEVAHSIPSISPRPLPPSPTPNLV